MEFLPKAFEALNNHHQFILFTLVPSKNRQGKTDKFPVDYRTGKVANAHEPAIWTDAGTAIAAAKQFGSNYGVGYVFTPNDPFFFIDIDDCLEFDLDHAGNPINSRWSNLALTILNAFPGAGVEVSSSGKGLHIIATGSSPKHACKNSPLNLEFYTTGRFVALTGRNATGSVGLDCSVVLPWLVDNFFKSKNSETVTEEDDFWSEAPCEGWSGPTDDDQLIERMLRSQSASSVFGGKATFKDLWERNEDALARNYPDRKRNRSYDESSADGALAQRLAYYTGNDCERMRRLMIRSGLTREKYNREDYLPRTIRGACGRQKEWLSDKQSQPIVNLNESQGVLSTFLNTEQQKEYFKGCAYILSSNRILIPGGLELDQSQFKSWYGGKNFTMDNENRRVSRNAWEAFTENQALNHTKVHGTAFKPQEAPGALIEEEGRIFINTYYPLNIPRKKGDPSPFIRHVEKVFVDERESTIILSYLASLARYIGVKFDWCPLIQGVEGNGKSLISLVAQYIIGKRYTQVPRVQDIGEKFNGWTYGACLVLVEDVRDKKRELIEVLKPMVTLARQSVEPKFENQRSADVCFNFIMNTNHRDGLHKTRNDRRIAPFFTRQQAKEDLKRDSMDADYFRNIFEWCLKYDGFAILADFFDNYDIPAEFDPTKNCRNAPITSATEVSIAESIGGVEQEILEAAEQGATGFKDGWASSIMMDHLLTKLKMNTRVSLNKRREILRSLGYDWHPALTDGRVNNIVLPDGGKPRLFIKVDHPLRNLMSPAEVAKAYTEAQTK